MFLRVIGRPLMDKVKEATGIVGSDAVPNAREVLFNLYNKTLKEIQGIPQGEGYRKAVEACTRYRLKVLHEEQDWKMMLERCSCAQYEKSVQVEELIQDARNELETISKLIDWNPWDVSDDIGGCTKNDAPAVSSGESEPKE